MNVTEIQKFLEPLILEYGVKLLTTLATLIIGFWIISIVIKVITKAFDRSNVEITIRGFLVKLISMILKVLLIISVIAMLGVETTSFVALLGGAGLAIGLALQGSLANFAGGVLILIFKPFKVGDFIETQGHSGTVKEIALFNTILNTPDKKTVIIPNGAVSNASITNYSAEEMRRVDFLFGIGYEDDLKKAKNIIWDELKKDDRILAEPEALVVISELADSSVNITVRVWCESANYWPIYFNITENVKLAFDAASISIPFPQQELHVRMKK